MAYFIDLLILPLIILAYFQSLQLTAILKLPMIYFFFILFIIIHIFSSMVAVLSNYYVHRRFKGSLWLMGFGPTIMSLLTLLVLNILPFLKWPFYLFKWLPFFDLWITPFIMGLVAFFTQIVLRKTVSETIYNIEDKIQPNEQHSSNK